MSSLSTEFKLPCGLSLPNRLVKAAMAEGMAGSGSLPSSKLSSLYNQWADGNWGAILTGNVQVDALQKGTPEDVAITAAAREGKDYDATLKLWKEWAEICQRKGTATMVQLNHPGRQSPFVARKGAAMAPSSVSLSLGTGIIAKFSSWLVFGVPREMTVDDIKLVVEQFAFAGKLAAEAGFKGIQLHAAHGYLLSQFLSPLSNTRTDAYGGSPTKRAQIVKEVIEAVRAATPKGFCIGIKINSADNQQENGLEESLEQIGCIHELVDFIEISGGSYENPRMMGLDNETESEPVGGELKATARTAARESFFIQYAQQARARFPSVPLMVTGGFRSRLGMKSAVDEGGCDLVGVGRPACDEPKLPASLILNQDVADDQAKVELKRMTTPWYVALLGLKPLTAGIITIAYQKTLQRLAKLPIT